jgi:alpha-L-fucosidase 2
LLLTSFAFPASAQEDALRYEQPAARWTEALPIGNGRLAAMVFGKTGREQLQLNEETIWAGTPVDDINPAARANLGRIQQLLLDGRNREAYDLTKKHMLGTPARIRSYQTLGDIFIDWSDSITTVNGYTRILDLSTAVHTTRYRKGDLTIETETFISSPADMLVMRLRATGGTLSFTLRLTRDIDAATVYDARGLAVMKGQIVDKDEPALKGPAGAHLRFAGIASVENRGGSKSSGKEGIKVSGATEVVIRFTAASDYDPEKLSFDRRIDPEKSCLAIIERNRRKNFDALLGEHLAEYTPLYRASTFRLGAPARTEMPTDQRLRLIKAGQRDAGIFPLFYHYGRYLLLSSSRWPARLPANLQGKWNPHFDAPWQSDYHTNINLQMNYWPADLANVSDTYRPLARFMKAMLPSGMNCAASMYGTKGWAMHHVTDIYGRTALNADPKWGTSPLAGAWMALSLFDHYDYTRDVSYLKEYAFPLMKASADFITGFLIRDRNGYLVTAPSMSPENGFLLPGDSSYRHVITYGPAIDNQIIHELFAAIRSVAGVMKLRTGYVDSLVRITAQLPPTRINRYGGIQEWIIDHQEIEPGHRHMSQLFGLYPGTTLTRDTALLAASRRTIERRLQNGGGHTGWSRAWVINFFARLKDGNSAFHHLELLLVKSTLPNLFDHHPPFQIDGNFGGTAGIAEMLLQSHNGEVHLLPALPDAWADGKVTGLRARGGLTVDMEWAAGKLIRVYVTASEAGSFRFRHGTLLSVVDLARGQKRAISFGSIRDN